MDFEFKEPTLELFTLLKTRKQKQLREYLLRTMNINIYKFAIEEKILQKNEQDFILMEQGIKQRLEQLEKEKEKDQENEAYIVGIDTKICEFYAQICDLDNFKKHSMELVEKNPSISLKLDMSMCKIRISIILEQRNTLIKHMDEAKFILEGSSDWDRKNKFKVYLGLYHLIKAEFTESAIHFNEALSSFDAPELMSFEQLTLYTAFTSMLTFSRQNLKVKLIDNPEMRRCNQYLELATKFFECHYNEMLRKLVHFIEFCEEDLFLAQFKEYFCKEMKIKMYHQLLVSYQSLQLTKMGQFFKVEPQHIEEDLRNFITEGKIPCVIDKVDGVVRMRNFKAEKDQHAFFGLCAELLRDIVKSMD